MSLYRLPPGQSVSVDEGQWVQGILCSKVQGVPLPLSWHPPMGSLGPPGSVELRASKGSAWDLHGDRISLSPGEKLTGHRKRNKLLASSRSPLGLGASALPA